MKIKTAYASIKQKLESRYKNRYSNAYLTDFSNLIALRSIEITRLWLAVRQYQNESFRLNLNAKEAIIHMLQIDANITLNSLDLILPSLALKLLNARYSAIDISQHPAYQEIESRMDQWLTEQRQERPLCFESLECLPELHWDDLPGELFPGLSENKSHD